MVNSLTHQTSTVGRSMLRLKFALVQVVLPVAMLWIKEVEVAKSVNDLLSIEEH